MTRALVIDPATGEIKRKVTAPPAMLAVQAGDGEAVFALVDDDGGHIDDANLIVGETGDWEVKEGAPEGLSLPSASIEYIAL